MMKKNKTLFFVLAVISSLCIICAVAALAINATDPNTKASQYAEKYDGSKDAYYKIFSSNDCIFLQEQFETAYTSSQSSEPGTLYFKRASGYMTASDERMKEIGCYK